MSAGKFNRKWVVLFSAFICNFLGGSLGYSAGIIHLGLLTKFKDSETGVAWAGALFTSVFCLSGPVSSFVINTLSCKRALIIGSLLNFTGFVVSSFSPYLELIIIAYGVIGGLGQSLVYTASVVITGFYFHDNPSLPTGVVVSGTGIGVTLFPLFTEFLLNTYRIEGTFLLLGAVTLQACPFAMCIHPHRLEREKKRATTNETNKSKSVFHDFRQIFSKVSFAFICLSILFWSMSLNISVLFLPEYHISTGSSEFQSALLMSCYGIANWLSRILTGLAATDVSIDGKMLYMGSFSILGICSLLFPLYGTHFAGKVFFSVILGIYSSGVWSLLTPICLEVVGVYLMSTAFGAQLFVCGVGFLVGPILGGNLKKSSGSFTVVFIISGVLYLLAAVTEILMILSMDTAEKPHINNEKSDYEFTVEDEGNDVNEIMIKRKS